MVETPAEPSPGVSTVTHHFAHTIVILADQHLRRAERTSRLGPAALRLATPACAVCCSLSHTAD